MTGPFADGSESRASEPETPLEASWLGRQLGEDLCREIEALRRALHDPPEAGRPATQVAPREFA